MIRKRLRATLPPEIESIFGDLRTKCRNCDMSELSFPIHPRGNWKAKAGWFGEAGGLREELGDLTFNGPAADQLDDTMTPLGILPDKHLLMANVTLCRPHAPEGTRKENRRPTAQEITLCRPNVEKLIRAHNPSLIIACGGVAAQGLMKNYPGSVSKTVGRFYGPEENVFGLDADMYVVFHPSYILRNPSNKSEWIEQLTRMRDYMLANGMLT